MKLQKENLEKVA